MLSKFEICGLVEEDSKFILESSTKVILTNSSFLIKVLGAPAIHHCFCVLKERLAHKIDKVVFNISDSLPAFYYAAKFNYRIEHSFTSKTAANIADRYSRKVL